MFGGVACKRHMNVFRWILAEGAFILQRPAKGYFDCFRHRDIRLSGTNLSVLMCLASRASSHNSDRLVARLPWSEGHQQIVLELVSASVSNVRVRMFAMISPGEFCFSDLSRPLVLNVTSKRLFA